MILEFFNEISLYFLIVCGFLVYVYGVMLIKEKYKSGDDSEIVFLESIPSKLYKREDGIRVIEILCMIWVAPWAIISGLLSVIGIIFFLIVGFITAVTHKILTTKVWNRKL